MAQFTSLARKKLRSRAGETIGETLVSLLIGALALTMLAGAVSTAGRLVNDSRNNLKNYYNGRDSMTLMERAEDSSDTATITGGSIEQSKDILIYKNARQFGGVEVAAYKIKP